MKAVEKAIELFDKMFWSTLTTKRVAKQCALNAVDEILNIYEKFANHPQTIYWEQVKTEIEKL